MNAQMKTPEEIADGIAWRRWSDPEKLMDAVHDAMTRAIKADRAQRAETAARAAEDAATLYAESYWYNYRENQGWEGGDLEHCAEWAARMALGLPVEDQK